MEELPFEKRTLVRKKRCFLGFNLDPYLKGTGREFRGISVYRKNISNSFEELLVSRSGADYISGQSALFFTDTNLKETDRDFWENS
ncbi:hypothetical protein CEXT_559991 [Caerostris extrusa]|uniref:Uncharacterized protein n=1 Tax=Caerostris extrusa TaxID=172846 RepID=A0AAV4P3X1_CAEEX|nr:hypothetical protein CEXT_559991 [Caerostris extrusa]